MPLIRSRIKAMAMATNSPIPTIVTHQAELTADMVLGIGILVTTNFGAIFGAKKIMFPTVRNLGFVAIRPSFLKKGL